MLVSSLGSLLCPARRAAQSHGKIESVQLQSWEMNIWNIPLGYWAPLLIAAVNAGEKERGHISLHFAEKVLSNLFSLMLRFDE